MNLDRRHYTILAGLSDYDRRTVPQIRDTVGESVCPLGITSIMPHLVAAGLAERHAPRNDTELVRWTRTPAGRTVLA